MESYEPTSEDLKQPCKKCEKFYDETSAMMQCGKCKCWWHSKCTSLGKVPLQQYFCSACRSSAHRKKEKLEVDDMYRFILPKENPDESVIVLEEMEGFTASQVKEMIHNQNIKTEQSLKNAMEKHSLEMKNMLETMNKFMYNVESRMMTEPKPSTSGVTKEEIKVILDRKGSHNRERQERENQQNDASSDSDTASVARHRSPIARADSQDNVKHLRQTLYELPVFSGEPTKWPKFIAAYRNSNLYAKFNDVENMMRLLKFVKGEALSLIEARLIHPSGVSKAIRILQRTYGDPILVTDGLVKAIMDSETPRETRPSSMVLFSIKVSDLVCYIKAMEEDDQLNNQFLLREILRRLPYSTQERWEEARVKIRHRANLEDFEEWLEDVADRYKSVAINNGGLKLQDTSRYSYNRSENIKKHPIHFHSNNESNSQDPIACVYCKIVSHSLKECQIFAELTRANRTQFLKTNRRCFYCYEKHKNFAECREKPKRLEEKQSFENERIKESPGSSGESYNHHAKMTGSKVIFRVVPITIHGPNSIFTTYAIIDDASSVTLIEAKVATDLKLKISQEDMPMELSWTQQTTTKFKCNKIVCYISGKSGEQFKLHNVFTVKGLNLPQQSIAVSELKKRYPYLKDVDMRDLEKVHPTMLLGLEHAHLGTPAFLKAGNFDEPIAMKTKLGWTIHGPYAHLKNESEFTFFTNHCQPHDDALNNLVHYQSTTDSFGIKPPEKTIQSVKNEKALDKANRKTEKNSGRLKSLLWKDEMRWRLICLKRKLNKNHELKKMYERKIAEHLEKGYTRKLICKNRQETPKNRWFLAYFPGFNINTPESNWKKLVNKNAWILRHIIKIRRKLKHKLKLKQKGLGNEDLTEAQNCLINQAQWECYSEETGYLKSGNKKSIRKSTFKKLHK